MLNAQFIYLRIIKIVNKKGIWTSATNLSSRDLDSSYGIGNKILTVRFESCRKEPSNRYRRMGTKKKKTRI